MQFRKEARTILSRVTALTRKLHGWNIEFSERLILGADSSGRRNTYYKLSMWSDDYDKEICTGWVYACTEN